MIGIIKSLTIGACIMWIIILIVLLIEWYCCLPDSGQYIKFSRFKNLYAVSPKRWTLFDSKVWFKTEPYGSVTFKFKFIDYYRYQYWHGTREKQKRQKRECDELQAVISTIKSDLAAFEEKNKARMSTAIKDNEDIYRRLSEYPYCQINVKSKLLGVDKNETSI